MNCTRPVWHVRTQPFRVPRMLSRVCHAAATVAPGFIDVHCHADFTVLDPNNPRDFKLRQGITTECAGQCGESAAPVNPDTLDLLKAYVAFEAPVQGVLSWRWRTFDEYLRELEGFDIPTNFVPMVGHGTVRIDAMGFESRPPTEDELARMKSTVREAMEAGAFGFSVGLAYAPGDYARNDEVIELAKVSAAYGGMFGTHMRDYGDGLRPGHRQRIAGRQQVLSEGYRVRGGQRAGGRRPLPLPRCHGGAGRQTRQRRDVSADETPLTDDCLTTDQNRPQPNLPMQSVEPEGFLFLPAAGSPLVGCHPYRMTRLSLQRLPLLQYTCETILTHIKTRRAVRSNPREFRLRVRLRQLHSSDHRHA